MSLPLHHLTITPPLNEAEQEMLRRQDSWTLSADGSQLRYETMVDSIRDAVEWIEIFVERLFFEEGSFNLPPAKLVEQGFTFDHHLNGILWLRGHEEDAVLRVENNELKLIRFPEPLNGFDWPALIRARGWLYEQNDENASPILALLDSLFAFLRSKDVPEELLDPSDHSGE